VALQINGQAKVLQDMGVDERLTPGRAQAELRP